MKVHDWLNKGKWGGRRIKALDWLKRNTVEEGGKELIKIRRKQTKCPKKVKFNFKLNISI